MRFTTLFGELGETVLSNSQFLRENFVGAPNLGIFWKHGQTTTPAAMSPTLEVHRFFNVPDSH